jgi:hypothetical protein
MLGHMDQIIYQLSWFQEEMSDNLVNLVLSVGLDMV